MNYKEILDNLRAENGNIVELYAKFEKQLKVETPPSVVRTSLLKEFGTRAKAQGIPGGWAQLRILASNLVSESEYIVSVDPNFGEESPASVAATIEVAAPVRKKTKKVKKKIKQRAPKPVVDTENPTETIQQESSQEILSESEEESGGELDGVDSEEDDSELDLGDVPEDESDEGEETEESEEPDIFS